MTGNEKTNPSGIPYDPSLTTPFEIISPSHVPKYQSLKWSLTALAAENTEVEPLISRISVPLFWTLLMKAFYKYSLSLTASLTDFPLTSAWLTSGY